jgi:hypothetical protein
VGQFWWKKKIPKTTTPKEAKENAKAISEKVIQVQARKESQTIQEGQQKTLKTTKTKNQNQLFINYQLLRPTN